MTTKSTSEENRDVAQPLQTWFGVPTLPPPKAATFTIYTYDL